ncbi:hypothetical protein EVAR_96814_1 [Eumeta japonica]|uniref:Uncharacterized protein n=1 Tax=Eumeta variegata TaxID=151549 RepID=A0A4C1WDM7_EUMVA|nr:hypothetical protein EVAR_96814_1 [Eumeta japonica]
MLVLDLNPCPRYICVTYVKPRRPSCPAINLHGTFCASVWVLYIVSTSTSFRNHLNSLFSDKQLQKGVVTFYGCCPRASLATRGGCVSSCCFKEHPTSGFSVGFESSVGALLDVEEYVKN